jgi:hypothetical protein
MLIRHRHDIFFDNNEEEKNFDFYTLFFSPLFFLPVVPLNFFSMQDEVMVLSDKNRGLAQYDAEDIDAYCMKAYRNFFFDPRYWFREISHAFSCRDSTVLKLGLRMLHLR